MILRMHIQTTAVTEQFIKNLAFTLRSMSVLECLIEFILLLSFTFRLGRVIRAWIFLPDTIKTNSTDL